MESLNSSFNSPQTQTIQALLRSHDKRNAEELQEAEIKALLSQAESKNLVVLEIKLSDRNGRGVVQ
jgi:hypothetical protein